MVINSSVTLSVTPDSSADAESFRPMLRWSLLIAASLALVLFALGRAGAVGAAAPATYDSTICINYFTCYNPTTGVPVSNTNSGYPTYVAPSVSSSGYPANTVVSTYFDARYCGGLVSVVTDASGNLIDVCTTTGQRIFPVFPDYGNGFAFGSGFINSNFVNGNVVNGVYPNFVNNNGFFNGTYTDIFTANGCPVGNFACLGFNPFGAFNTFVGATTTTTGTTSTGVTTVTRTTPGQGQTVTYYPREVAQPAAVTAAPQHAAAPASAAPAIATPLNSAPVSAPATDIGGGVKILSVQTTTVPAANNDGRDDGK